ncbi:hypothetical protein HDU98_007836 [Podochytrium sp. JEL0797]|nr:hypothetical protein HDU98_007836 [Podochytrium sp. JEL0797]
MDSFLYSVSRAHRILIPNVDMSPLPPTVSFEHNVDIPMRDGTTLKANIYRPKEASEPLPIILCAHPYSKDILPKRGLLFDSVPLQYRVMRQPRTVRFSEATGWESPDPAFWATHGYICVNIDLRGFFESAGAAHEEEGVDLISDQEALDYYDAIEFLGTREWCSGKVGLCGVSYLAISQYKVAALKPPHLAAIMPWEGLSDFYKDIARPGGVRDDGFAKIWTDAMLGRTKCNLRETIVASETRDAKVYQDAVTNLQNIECPAFICMSYSDHGLHTNGSMRAFRAISSKQKWLYTHRDGKWVAFYENTALQCKFFDYFLKGETGNGMDRVPRVRIEVRAVGDKVHSVKEFEDAMYPPAETVWRTLYFGTNQTLVNTPSNSGSNETVALYSKRGNISFTYVFDEDTVVSGPMKVELQVASATLKDMNLFAYIRKYDAHGAECVFEGQLGWGRDVVTKGWQRLALRAPYESYKEIWDADKPFNKIEFLEHDLKEMVTIQLLPSSTFFEKGSSMVLFLQGYFMHPWGPLQQMCYYQASQEEGELIVYLEKGSLLFGTL